MTIGQIVHSRRQVGSKRGVVAAGHEAEAAAGVRILEQGGNAVDAAVAAAFVAFVVEPNNCSVGGYGHLASYLPEHGGFVTVDHGPRVPLAGTPDMFRTIEDPDAGPYDWPDVVDDANDVGGLSVATPGAVPGLWAIHQRAGRLPWRDLLQPAIEEARAGVRIDYGLLIEIVARMALIRRYPAAAGWLLRDGDPPAFYGQHGPGDRLDGQLLARTLERIADEGPDALHRGEIAERIAAAVQADGGILTVEDLAAYEPKVFVETPVAYRGMEVVTANDQVGAEALNILARFPLGDYEPGGFEHHHLLAEAVGHAFVDNQTHYGDPDHTESPVAGLASAAFAAERARRISLDRVAPRPIAAADPWPYDEGAAPVATPLPSVGGTRGTTQIVTADGDGNVVALITTIGGDYGSLIVVPETGILLNNSMMNWDPRPGRSNSIAPGKMPFFAVPAIVAARDGKAVFAAAGAGGYRILASVMHTTVGVLDHGLPVQEAVDLPRSHGQGEETYVDALVPAAVRERLRAAGHELVIEETTPAWASFGRVGAVTVDPESGELAAAAGPFWSTASGAASDA
ncbi:gamma-glutamyltransferase family protein [Patulibacter defluvii]|uniref:gamma-glutamyltransferase family protein n=1 Tax=Patulibacter defluvii TaxID=3095358 RepID=UPI002A75CFE3|nr:gamma-glutamyltransferase [Patulibacter sp. DM4]